MKSKRALANVGLVLVILLGGAITVYQGLNFMDDYLTYQAKAQSSYTTTELGLLMDSIHSAPEGTTFIYNTPMDEHGYPVIGSLEIDTDDKHLCIHPYTEWEIYSSILSNALFKAGQSAAVFSVDAARGGVSGYSQAMYSNFNTYMTTSVLPRSVVNTMGTDATREAFEQVATNQIARDFVTGNKEMRQFLRMPASGPIHDAKTYLLENAAENPKLLKKLYSAKTRTEFDQLCIKNGVTKTKVQNQLWKQRKVAPKLYGSKDGKIFSKAASNPETRNALKNMADDPLTRKSVAKILPKQSLWTRIKSKLPFTREKAAAQNSALYQGYYATNAQKPGLLIRGLRWTTTKVVSKLPPSWQTRLANSALYNRMNSRLQGSNYKLANKGSIILGVILLDSYETENFNYIMSQIVYDFMIKKTVKTTIEKLPAIIGVDSIEEACFKTPLGPACLTTRAGRAALVISTEVITTGQFMKMIWDMSQGARAERENMQDLTSCVYYSGSSNEVLAYPHNCQPIVRFGKADIQGEVRPDALEEDRMDFWDKEMREVDDGWRDAKRFYNNLKKSIRNPFTIGSALRDFFGLLHHAVRLGTNFLREGAHIADDQLEISEKISEATEKYTPHADCAADFDKHQTALAGLDESFAVQGVGCNLDIGQDCPNYYISYPPSFKSSFVGKSPFAIVAGGTTAAVGVAFFKPGWSSLIFLVDYFGATLIFYQYPAQVSAEIVKADMFPKEIDYQDVNGVRYNDNEGYYYMELPAAIQFSKIYFPDEPDPEKRSRVVITKG